MRSAAAILCRIRHWIPKDNYLTIYHALFESHLTYGITVWGGIPTATMNKIFIIQKHCIRILFGDAEMYKEKFSTCARIRPYTGKDSQKLGKAFFCKEHTKRLFNQHSILAANNLYIYHCCIEIFKIMKFRNPINLYETLNISRRNDGMLLKTPTPSIQFLYAGPKIWNSVYKKIFVKILGDLSTSVAIVKNSVKKLLLRNQKKHDENDWHEENIQIT